MSDPPPARQTANSRRAADAAAAITSSDPNPSQQPNSSPTTPANPLSLTDDQWAGVTQLIANAVAAAMAASAPALSVTSKPKRAEIKAPDVFDGSEPTAALTFLNECALVFRARAEDYSTGISRVNYAALHLRGAAQLWFISFLNNPSSSIDTDSDNAEPSITDDWDAFRTALTETFGEADPTSVAESKLTSLGMANHHHVSRYAADFAALVSQTTWDDSSRRAQFYKGLAPRIKDALSTSGQPRPRSYKLLVTRCREIDQLYWERKEEEARETRSRQTPANSRSNLPSYSPSPSVLAPPISISSLNPSSPPFNRDKRSSSPQVDLTGKIGPDGRLTAEEKKRRRDHDLCLFCGSADHNRASCPTAPPPSNPVAVARAAALAAATASSSTSAN